MKLMGRRGEERSGRRRASEGYMVRVHCIHYKMSQRINKVKKKNKQKARNLKIMFSLILADTQEENKGSGVHYHFLKQRIISAFK